MAFNINAHVILSGPKNIKAVTKNIQKQLGTVKASVQLDIPKNLGKNIGGFNKGIKNLTATASKKGQRVDTQSAPAISYANHLQSQQQAFKSRYNLFGLEVRKLLSDDFLIRYVMPDLPAMASGFKVGDIITQVNGINAKEISKDKWLSLSATPGEYEICRQSLPCIKLQSQYIDGYSNL